MILVTRDHMVRNRVVAMDEGVSPDELVSIRNYVNRNFSGWRLGDARRELMRRWVKTTRCTTYYGASWSRCSKRDCWRRMPPRKCTWAARPTCLGSTCT